MSVLGHALQRERLQQLAQKGSLSHAYLFAGPEGIGKRMVAEELIASLGGAEQSPEVLRLGGDGSDKSLSIERIRGMRSWLALRPFQGAKIALLDGADLLGHEAANALLKTLEEPPSYGYLFLVTARPLSVLPTIRSRCERIDFRELPDDIVRRILADQVLDDDDRALLAAVGSGRPGYALRLVQEKRTEEIADAIQGFEKALKAGIAERLAYAKRVAEYEHAPDIVAWWLAWVHAKLSERPRLALVAQELLTLTDTLRESAYNRRLAFDRFFLAIH